MNDINFDPGDIQKVPLVIKIIKTPVGSAPEWVREKWVGLELIAGRMPEDAKECDFITHERSPNRGGYLVPKKIALRALGKKSVSAALWLENHLADLEGSFVFGPDEAIKVETVHCEHLEF
jgi:hypothetical protein